MFFGVKEGLVTAANAGGLTQAKELSSIAGLAGGIDTAAHEEALRIGARTVAIIGTRITKT